MCVSMYMLYMLGVFVDGFFFRSLFLAIIWLIDLLNCSVLSHCSSFCLFACLFLCSNYDLSVYPSIHPSIHLSIHPSICLYLSFCIIASWLTDWLSMYLLFPPSPPPLFFHFFRFRVVFVTMAGFPFYPYDFPNLSSCKSTHRALSWQPQFFPFCSSF